MRQFSSHSRQPRRGQALLLAVLIMIFAALLSASFITIVSVNLNQTARQADKNRAAASAKAGLDYVNRQLAFSAEGENWRPRIPNENLAAYYTPLDRAQGWAGTYAKYPNPLDEQGINNGPQFLAKVERISYNRTLIADPADYDRPGSLKITVIGLSPEDPTAYSRTIFYKGGYQNEPIAQNMRVVSNWDFKNNLVPVAQAIAYNGNTRVVTLKNVKGDFPPTPFAVMIGDPRTTVRSGVPGTRGAVVVNVDKTVSPPTFTFAHPGTAGLAITANERIELAASIGSPNGLNYNNASPAVGTPISDPVKVADNSPGGIRVNGGLWLTGIASSESLRSIKDAYVPAGINLPLLAPAAIQTSGMLGRDVAGSNTRFEVRGQGIPTTGNSNDLADSAQATFPGAWTPTPTTTYDRRSKDLLVSDAWNRLSGSVGASRPSTDTIVPDSTGTRMVTDFVPPALDSPENLDRYRKLTRFSTPATGTNEAVSLHGEGRGIYIDNAEDKERVFNSATNTFTEMSQTELVKMWVSRPIPATAAPDNYMRTGNPAPTNITTASLEQQHLRGWVGPDEFRGRGVEIELGNGVVTITRDARDDNRAINPDGTVGTLNGLGGVLAKAWKNPNTGVSQPGVYSRTFAWPLNGVIFAEGNVRIRGSATNAPRSLTVVSMGNIYIEDTLQITSSTTPRNNAKILLLAKKNVVMNPTRVLGRPDVQTIAKSVTTFTIGTNVTVEVADASGFQIGDLVRAFTNVAGTETVSAQGYVTAKTATADPTDSDSITVAPTTAGLVAVNALLRTPSSVPTATTAAPFVAYNAIASGTDVIQRRINTPVALPATNPLRLAFNHGGDRPTTAVFSVKTSNNTSSDVFLSHKRVSGGAFATATNVSDVDKIIRADYTAPTTGTDNFPNVAPTDQTTAEAQISTQIKTEMDSRNHGAGPNSWSYNATVNAAYANVPFFYLAGIGNRLEYGIASTVTERRATINSATPYDMPLATSIGLVLNGIRPTISNESYNGTDYDNTTQFGFNPTYMDSTATPPANTTIPREDILTADRSFYQADATKNTLDSRAFGATVAGFNPLVLRQSDNLIGLGTVALPAYRVAGIKRESVGLVGNNSSTVSTINPGYTFNVNAYVYAQTGSWFVIPGGSFDNRLRSTSNATTGVIEKTYLDIDNDSTADSGEYIDADTSTTFTLGDFADLNRNGVIDEADRYAMARYSRYNYQINFTGTIAEYQTPIVNTMRSGVNATDPIVANGSVEAWMLSWSTVVKQAMDDANTPTINEAVPNYGRMTYTFDADYVTGRLVDDPNTLNVDETDTGFRLPQTTEVFNVS